MSSSLLFTFFSSHVQLPIPDFCPRFRCLLADQHLHLRFRSHMTTKLPVSAIACYQYFTALLSGPHAKHLRLLPIFETLRTPVGLAPISTVSGRVHSCSSTVLCGCHLLFCHLSKQPGETCITNPTAPCKLSLFFCVLQQKDLVHFRMNRNTSPL